MKKLFILTILAVSLVLTGCVKKDVEVNKGVQDDAQLDNSVLTQDSSASSRQAGENVDDDTKRVQVGNDKIKVFNIEDGQTIFSPITIQGETMAFENNLIIELRNSAHETMVKEFTTIKSGEVGEIGDYSITLEFEFNNTKEGFIAVYEQSPKDGSELNLVEIPVKFGNIDTSDKFTN